MTTTPSRRRSATASTTVRPGRRPPPARSVLSKWVAWLAPALLVGVGLAACSEPPLPDGPTEQTTSDTPQPADDATDDDVQRLHDHVAQFSSAVDVASGHLDAAAAATSRDQLRQESQRALGVLLEDAGTRPMTTTPLLPAESPEREVIGERSDLLGTTLALARDVGGDHGGAVVDLLRDEVAGDLGAWDRDAAGVVAAAERAAGGSDDLEQLTTRILELPGEATRALAWTFVAVEADDAELGTSAASRAAAHLGLVRLSLDELAGQLRGGSGGS